MNRPIIMHKLNREFLVSTPGAVDMVPRPSEPHYFRGPHGGRYRGYGPWFRIVGEMHDDFMRNEVTVMDRGARIRYLRPGTKEWIAA